MQIAIQIFGYLSVIGGISIGILLYYHKQTPAVWVTFFTFTSLTLSLCLNWQQSILDRNESTQSKKTAGYIFDIKYQNVMILPFLLPKETNNEKVNLIFYKMVIANCTHNPATIKSVLLQYKLDGIDYTKDSFIIKTGRLLNGEENAALIIVDSAHIFLQGWYNLRRKINELKVLEPGGVLSGSAVFPLEAKANDLGRIEDLKLVIRDYSNNISIHDIEIQPEWINALKKGGIFINTKFSQQANNIVNFVH
ncbi:MAG: hypothetical protein C4548_06080 [Desulfobacteraceae bacterium]|nr:MAG: hypothetical protein C4548_06080 [Desulfobacteraceae bacterium]